MSNAPRMRASDAEREQAAQALREHYAAGRPDEQELGERLEGVYEARTAGASMSRPRRGGVPGACASRRMAGAAA